MHTADPAKTSQVSLGRLHLYWLLIVGLLAAPELMAVMVPLATTTLVDRASCIVEGRVTSVASHWTDDRSGIVTAVEVEVADALLGDTNRVTFVYQGGGVDGVEQRVSDMPVVKSGQQLLVFLRKPFPVEALRQPQGRLRASGLVLVGSAQGLCRITGEKAAKSGFSVMGDAAQVDRNLDVGALKSLIRQRLKDTQRTGGEL